MLGEVPTFPKLAKKATGTRHKQARLAPQVELSPDEIESVLSCLPVLSLRRRKGKSFFAQARFIFAYETGLRPETLDKLLARDVTVSGLHMRAELDKNRWERVIPLSVRARAALKSLGTLEAAEPLFGEHDYRAVFRKACVRALGAERGDLVTPYDLKHARVTHLLEAGAPIPGIKFMTGTDVALDHYMQPSRRAAEAAIGGHSGDGAKKGVGSPTENSKKQRCEGEDLNLHGSYPASTSIQLRITEQPSGPKTVARRLPGAEPDTLLANEAQALLEAAASQQQVETARLRAFARACLELSETGRLALAVLDGGLFASRRALELAAHVLRDAEQHAVGDSDADAIKKTVA